MIEDHKRCKNCSHHLLLSQKFCHESGQKADTHRINYHFLAHEIQHGIFHVDKGIFFKLKELFTRPGHSIREYLQGKRQNHFKPVLLIMILGTVAIILNKLLFHDTDVILDTAEFDNIKKDRQYLRETTASKGGAALQNILEGFEKISIWMNEHFALTILILIPFSQSHCI